MHFPKAELSREEISSADASSRLELDQAVTELSSAVARLLGVAGSILRAHEGELRVPVLDTVAAAAHHANEGLKLARQAVDASSVPEASPVAVTVDRCEVCGITAAVPCPKSCPRRSAPVTR